MPRISFYVAALISGHLGKRRLSYAIGSFRGPNVRHRRKKMARGVCFCSTALRAGRKSNRRAPRSPIACACFRCGRLRVPFVTMRIRGALRFTCPSRSGALARSGASAPLARTRPGRPHPCAPAGPRHPPAFASARALRFGSPRGRPSHFDGMRYRVPLWRYAATAFFSRAHGYHGRSNERRGIEEFGESHHDGTRKHVRR